VSNSAPIHSNSTRGYAIALASAALLSTTAIFIRHLTQTYRLPPLVLAFWRAGFVSATLLTTMGLLQPDLRQVKRQDVPFLSVYGWVLALFNGLWTVSVSVNGAAIATVLVYCSAAFTALLGRWWFRERLDGTKALAISLTLGGCALVSGALNMAAWRVNLLGIGAGVLSGLGYSAYTLMGRAAAQRGLNPWTTLFYTFSFAAAFLLFFNLSPGNLFPGSAARPADLFVLGDAWTGWFLLLLLAAGPTVAGFGLYNVSLVYLPSSVVNLIVTVEPVSTATIAYVLLGERMSGLQIGGGLLIMAGVMLLRLREGSMAS
jgi:drug/metabolite transporter (DMT)-like permease